MEEALETAIRLLLSCLRGDMSRTWCVVPPDKGMGRLPKLGHILVPSNSNGRVGL